MFQTKLNQFIDILFYNVHDYKYTNKLQVILYEYKISDNLSSICRRKLQYSCLVVLLSHVSLSLEPALSGRQRSVKTALRA